MLRFRKTCIIVWQPRPPARSWPACCPPTTLAADHGLSRTSASWHPGAAWWLELQIKVRLHDDGQMKWSKLTQLFCSAEHNSIILILDSDMKLALVLVCTTLTLARALLLFNDTVEAGVWRYQRSRADTSWKRADIGDLLCTDSGLGVYRRWLDLFQVTSYHIIWSLNSFNFFFASENNFLVRKDMLKLGNLKVSQVLQKASGLAASESFSQLSKTLWSSVSFHPEK